MSDCVSGGLGFPSTPSEQAAPQTRSADGPVITRIRFTAASDWHREQGLLGFIQCVIDGRMVLDGITLRRTRDNRLTLSYPEREDGVGRRHPIIRPIDDAARRAIEAAIIGSLDWSKP